MAFLTRTDVAERLKVSVKRAGTLMRTMPCVKIGGRQYRVSEEDFAAWVAQSKEIRSPYLAGQSDPRRRLDDKRRFLVDDIPPIPRKKRHLGPGYKVGGIEPL